MENPNAPTVKNAEVVPKLFRKHAMILLEKLVNACEENAEVKGVPVGNPVGNPYCTPCLQHVCHFFSDGKRVETLEKPRTSPSVTCSEKKTPFSEGVVVVDPADEDDLYA